MCKVQQKTKPVNQIKTGGKCQLKDKWCFKVEFLCDFIIFINQCQIHLPKSLNIASLLQLQTLSNIEMMDKMDKNYTYLDLLKTPKMRQLTLLTGIVWWVSPPLTG